LWNLDSLKVVYCGSRIIGAGELSRVMVPLHFFVCVTQKITQSGGLGDLKILNLKFEI
jgi:hypothetical protein